jgi:hypothetical protein
MPHGRARAGQWPASELGDVGGRRISRPTAELGADGRSWLPMVDRRARAAVELRSTCARPVTEPSMRADDGGTVGSSSHSGTPKLHGLCLFGDGGTGAAGTTLGCLEQCSFLYHKKVEQHWWDPPLRCCPSPATFGLYSPKKSPTTIRIRPSTPDQMDEEARHQCSVEPPGGRA